MSPKGSQVPMDGKKSSDKATTTGLTHSDDGEDFAQQRLFTLLMNRQASGRQLP